MDPENSKDLDPTTSPAVDPRQSRTTQSSPKMLEHAELTGLEAAYTLSPQPITQTASPSAAANQSSADPARQVQFDTGIQVSGALRHHAAQGQQQPYMPPGQTQRDSLWSAPVRVHDTGDEFENYALHSSSTARFLPPAASSQSSPRSWTSPDHFRSVSWESVPEHLANPYPRQSQQVAAFQLEEGTALSRETMHHYVQNSLSIPATSFPVAGPYLQTPNFNGNESGFRIQGHQDPFQSHYPLPPGDGGGTLVQENNGTLSPCSSTLGIKMEDDMFSPGTALESGEELLGSHYPSEPGLQRHSQRSSSIPSPNGGDGTLGKMAGNKNEEPYAKLIYRAFMSTPRHALTLQEIYQWFRDNTDKGKKDGKGWQNSIRHNLSMNLAFTKRERTSSSGGSDDAAVSSVPDIFLSTGTAADNKKSTEWFLEPWAIEDGVQSTTRYRKGNPSRRAAGMGSRGHNYSGARLPGRKGGILSGRVRAKHSSSHHSGTAAAAAIQMQYYPQHMPQHRQRLQHSLMHGAGPASGEDAPYGAFLVGGGSMSSQLVNLNQGGGGSSSRISVDFEYSSSSANSDYPAPQLFQPSPLEQHLPPPHHQHNHSHSHSHPHHYHNRTPSESVIDEPITPETSFAEDAAPVMLLPDLRTTAGPSSSSSSLSTDGLPYFAGEETALVYPLQPIVGVYDEDMVTNYSWGNGDSSSSSAGGVSVSVSNGGSNGSSSGGGAVIGIGIGIGLDDSAYHQHPY
ncbi:hypothetical protein B0T24DRAFT_1887 [Lasiosphaeria ovina]|uniref:Fork-head domain-containing protein n=1 Tax=Lasiosphaeria ovina TaxID=92902 RepID=A0AAE0NII9_9PEZI|nr:hypothetical protein B0T24DRAFT_1887 [Lasiosphaeria ovina]